jgi:hypothetical protein
MGCCLLGFVFGFIVLIISAEAIPTRLIGATVYLDYLGLLLAVGFLYVLAARIVHRTLPTRIGYVFMFIALVISAGVYLGYPVHLGGFLLAVGFLYVLAARIVHGKLQTRIFEHGSSTGIAARACSGTRYSGVVAGCLTWTA